MKAEHMQWLVLRNVPMLRWCPPSVFGMYSSQLDCLETSCGHGLHTFLTGLLLIELCGAGVLCFDNPLVFLLRHQSFPGRYASFCLARAMR